MNTLEPINPKDRDPNLVMIGIPSMGEGLWDLVRNVISLETQPNDRGLKFHVRRCKDPGGIGKARNSLAHVARCVGASTLIMIDRDILATAKHVFKLLDHGPEVNLIGALYPLRQTPLAWVGEFLPATPATIGPKGEWPMQHVGTGLIRIDMRVFDILIQKGLAPWYEHEDCDPRVVLEGQIPHGAHIHDFFGMGVRKDMWFGNAVSPGERLFNRYVTEDYMISYLWRKAGGKCWVDSECQVGHWGGIDYLGLEAAIEKRVDDALSQYKKDLQSVGVEIPVLQKNEDGTVGRLS
jgi:hypothetical protein